MNWQMIDMLKKKFRKRLLFTEIYIIDAKMTKQKFGLIYTMITNLYSLINYNYLLNSNFRKYVHFN